MKPIDTTSVDSIMETTLGTFPDALFGDDIDGQLIIYTGLYQVGDPSTPLITEDEKWLVNSAKDTTTERGTHNGENTPTQI